MNTTTVLALSLLAAACSTPRAEQVAPLTSPSATPASRDDAADQPGASPEVTAMARRDSEPMHDWNDNGIDDTIDIVTGTSEDENLNGIPDEAEAEQVEAPRDR